MMQNLITIEKENAVVTVDTIEKFAGVKMKSIQSLVRENMNELKDLDSFKFEEISNRSEINWHTVAFTENQVIYLLTLMRNTEQVKNFKFNLVKQFIELREQNQTLKDLQLKEMNSKIQLLEFQLKAKQLTTTKATTRKNPNRRLRHKELASLVKDGILKATEKTRYTYIITPKGKELGYNKSNGVIYQTI